MQPRATQRAAMIPAMISRGRKVAVSHAQRVQLLRHPVRVREAHRVELVRAPFAFGPVAPILHDVVERNAAFPKTGDDIEAFLRGVVALARLPEAEGPEGHHRRGAGQRAVTGDHAVG